MVYQHTHGRVLGEGGWLGFDIAATSTLNCTKRSWSTEGDFVPCIGPPHSARKQLCSRTQRGILEKGEREQLRSSSNIFLEDIFVAEPFAYCTLHLVAHIDKSKCHKCDSGSYCKPHAHFTLHNKSFLRTNFLVRFFFFLSFFLFED